jgi:hypothetical protein
VSGQAFGIWLTMSDGTAAWATTAEGRLIVAGTAEAIASELPNLGEPRVIRRAGVGVPRILRNRGRAGRQETQAFDWGDRE